MRRTITDPAEERLLRELETIELRIAQLTVERESISRLLVSVRRSNPETSLRQVTRKNSVRRVLIESIVLEKLESGLAKTFELYSEVKRVAPDMNENSFRTILHRMKDRGLITNPKSGRWIPSVASEVASKGS